MWWRDDDWTDYAELVRDPSSARLMLTAAAGHLHPWSCESGLEAVNAAAARPEVVTAFHAAGDDRSYPAAAADSVDTWTATVGALMARGLPEPIAVRRSMLVFGLPEVDIDYLSTAAVPGVDDETLLAAADEALARGLAHTVADPVSKDDPTWDESEVVRDAKGRFAHEGARPAVRNVGGRAVAVSQAVAERKKVARAEPVATAQADSEQLAYLAQTAAKREAKEAKALARRKRLARINRVNAVNSVQAANAAAEARRQAEARAARTGTARAGRTATAERTAVRRKYAAKLRRAQAPVTEPFPTPPTPGHGRSPKDLAIILVTNHFGDLGPKIVDPDQAKLGNLTGLPNVDSPVMVDKDGQIVEITHLAALVPTAMTMLDADDAYQAMSPAYQAVHRSQVFEEVRQYLEMMYDNPQTLNALGMIENGNEFILVSPNDLLDAATYEDPDNDYLPIGEYQLSNVWVAPWRAFADAERRTLAFHKANVRVQQSTPLTGTPASFHIVVGKAWDESEVNRDDRGRFAPEGAIVIGGKLHSVRSPSQVRQSTASTAAAVDTSAAQLAYLRRDARRKRVARLSRVQATTSVNAARSAAARVATKPATATATEDKVATGAAVARKYAATLQSAVAIAAGNALASHQAESTQDADATPAGGTGLLLRTNGEYAALLVDAKNSGARVLYLIENGRFLPAEASKQERQSRITEAASAADEDKVWCDIDTVRRLAGLGLMLEAGKVQGARVILEGSGTRSDPFYLDQIIEEEDPSHAYNQVLHDDD